MTQPMTRFPGDVRLRREDLRDDDPITLKEASEVLLRGIVSVSALRSEIRRGQSDGRADREKPIYNARAHSRDETAMPRTEHQLVRHRPWTVIVTGMWFSGHLARYSMCS